MAVRRPELELGVAADLQGDRDGRFADADVEVSDDLGVASIQAFGEADDRREQADHVAALLR